MRRSLFVIFAIVVGNSTTLWAQALPLPIAVVTAAAAAEPDASAVRLLVGRSTVIDAGSPIARVSLTSADIADAMVTSPNQLLINGKTPGTISMFVWNRAGAIRRYELIVQRDLSRLSEQVGQLFPGEAIHVESNGRDIVLSGSVSSKDVGEKAVSLAAGYVEKKEEVTNLLQVRPDGASNQVLLQVRFAEVSRNALTELGASWFTGANGYKNFLARGTTEQFAAPDFFTTGQVQQTVQNHLQISDFLNLFLFDMKNQIGAMIKALQTKGLFQSLAEPNLVAESGKEASFLAGGEYPIPIAQPSGGAVTVTVQFKEYGIRLNFTPVVTGTRVHLKVRPEVSTLDFNNAVVLSGFRIPALVTRRTETELELEDGQTFAISGLLNNTMTKSLRKVPGIGDIPILGMLFRSEAAQKDRTELWVMITPHILPRNSPGVPGGPPRLAEPYLPPLTEKQSLEPPPAAFPSGRAEAVPPQPAVAPAPLASARPGPASPSDAARVVSALTPSGPKVLPAAPAPAAAPNAAAASATSRLKPDEKKALERAQRQEREQAQLDLRAKAAGTRRMADQAEKDRRLAAKAKERQAKLDREQAKRDREAARRAGEAARKAQEVARRQAEIDRKQQKQIDAAAARLSAAQATYQAEVAKKNQQQQRP